MIGRRDFLQMLALAAAAGLALDRRDALAAEPGAAERLYRVPAFGNVSLLHFTDCHAQLRPIYFREPSVNLGVGPALGRPPHLVGEKLLEGLRIAPGPLPRMRSPASTSSRRRTGYGRVGGFAHLATLVKQLRASRPGALLLDGGDTWQGSATALWTNGQDMVDACKLLGVDMMSAHWEFTLGAKRVQRDRRQGSEGPDRVPRAEREDHRFRRPGLRALRLAGDQRRRRRRRRPGLPVHADRQPAPLRSRLDLRHPGREPAEDGRRRRARKAPRSSSCSRTTAWTST